MFILLVFEVPFTVITDARQMFSFWLIYAARQKHSYGLNCTGGDGERE